MPSPNRLVVALLGAFAAAITAHDTRLNHDTCPVAKRSSPRNIADALAALEKIYSSTSSFSNIVTDIVLDGLSSLSLRDVGTAVVGLLMDEQGHGNNNPIEPFPAIYPSVSTEDAPYDIDEATLRSAIYIPSGFQYGAQGAPQPVLLCGGTGNPGYVSFAGSWIPILQREGSFGDPVWLNVPGNLNNDYQSNAEYVAYAIHYLSSISNNTKIAVFGFSQGNLDAQWAYKYWPSTRGVVTDHVGFSPGYRGSQLVRDFLGGGPTSPTHVAMPAGWLQAEWMSAFVQTLLSDGGDSAYVPTTIIYSSTDEVVQPQTGANASAVLRDERGVGVTNARVQDVCKGHVAGTVYGHETIMVHPLAHALAKDALAHDGPGLVERVDVESVCGRYLAPGLELGDLVLTENTLVWSLATLMMDAGKSTMEPVIKSYAASNGGF